MNLLNPKVILFNAASVPQFVDPAAGNVVGQFLVLGLTLVLVNLAIDDPIGLAAGYASRMLRRSWRSSRRSMWPPPRCSSAWLCGWCSFASEPPGHSSLSDHRDNVTVSW